MDSQIAALRQRVAELEARNQVLEGLVSTDELSGLLNRRAFQQRLAEELRRCERHHRELSLLMLDLDNFKAINDSLGHMAGDAALRLAAEAIKRCLRQTDIVARYGGEEFAVALPDTGPAGAMEAAERLRERMSEVKIRNTRITVSIGVASLSAALNTAESLMLAADAQLYRAKEAGKNRVCASDQLC